MLLATFFANSSASSMAMKLEQVVPLVFVFQLFFLVVVLVLDVNALPQRRVFDWELDARSGAPDGFNRSMLVVNGQLPGPLTAVNVGDTVVGNVLNSLDFQIALHWHGL
ncbi:hypothetical protein JCM8547_004384 [Rhodosporidiobolus lusitaniae]